MAATTNFIKTTDGYVASDPSGVWIYLIESELDVEYNIIGKSFSVLGTFVGISIETGDMAKSIAL